MTTETSIIAGQLWDDAINCDFDGFKAKVQAALAAHPSASPEGAEPVAEIGSDWQLLFVGSGPIAPIVEKHGLKIGSKLYAHPLRSVPVAEAASDEILQFESALSELVNKIDSRLDTGDLLADSRRASDALDVILKRGDLVANAHDYFRDSEDRYEKSVEFRIGWDACLDALSSARTAAPASMPAAGVPEGWKLVPVEPTDAMTFVGQKHRYESVWSIGAIYREMLAAAPASAPDAGVPEGGWIDVNDHLPTQAETVIGYYKPFNGEWQVGEVFANIEGFSLLSLGHDASSIAVSHWMPLPEAPGTSPDPASTQPPVALTLDDVRQILACEIECSVFEECVLPALATVEKSCSGVMASDHRKLIAEASTLLEVIADHNENIGHWESVSVARDMAERLNALLAKQPPVVALTDREIRDTLSAIYDEEIARECPNDIITCGRKLIRAALLSTGEATS